ncbi:hypothetical protein NKJ46_23785, partial [Mesorhizobium sp. M0166]|uniref:hypothetical protein n=1 Tax=Mesorhizobium sp. M0166 TaxID=2956902 RepID=UPI00333BDE35
GAPMQNLAHSASFDSDDNDEPSKPGIKQLGLRDAVLSAQRNLKASGPLFWQLCGLVDKLHEVLAIVAEKEPDYRMPNLGLLPLPEEYSTRK